MNDRVGRESDGPIVGGAGRRPNARLLKKTGVHDVYWPKAYATADLLRKAVSKFKIFAPLA